MENSRMEQQLQFIMEIDRMKSVYRRTLLVDHSRRETDAEHSWHFALMALLLAEYAGPDVKIDRVIRMALVHDLVEIYAGDTFAYDGDDVHEVERRVHEVEHELYVETIDKLVKA